MQRLKESATQPGKYGSGDRYLQYRHFIKPATGNKNGRSLFPWQVAEINLSRKREPLSA